MNWGRLHELVLLSAIPSPPQTRAKRFIVQGGAAVRTPERQPQQRRSALFRSPVEAPEGRVPNQRLDGQPTSSDWMVNRPPTVGWSTDLNRWHFAAHCQPLAVAVVDEGGAYLVAVGGLMTARDSQARGAHGLLPPYH